MFKPTYCYLFVVTGSLNIINTMLEQSYNSGNFNDDKEHRILIKSGRRFCQVTSINILVHLFEKLF